MAIPEYTGTCPSGVFERRFTVTREMTDAQGQMGLGDLAREMEKSTEQQLGSYGVGRRELQEEGKIWVVAWTSIEAWSLPQAGAQVLLWVWPGKNKSMMYTRRYAFYSADGEPLAEAASLFLLMDQKTRSAAAPTGKLASVPIVTLEGEPELPKLRMEFPAQLPGCHSRTVAGEEIDLNGHLNNTRYLDWARELWESQGKGACPFQKAWIQYCRELKEGQQVSLWHGLAEGAWYLLGTAEDVVSFRIKMEA